LKRRLDREAKKREDGSLSAEIAHRLERSFEFPALKQVIATAVAEGFKNVEFRPTGSVKKGGDQ
jgi:hypothetical protein